MKHEWRKKEKGIYLPKNKPEIVDIPKFKFLTVKGEGNPNDDGFSDYIEALYSLSYGIKMSPKKGLQPEGFYDYTVYPLEGVWDLNEEAKKNFTGTFSKDDLVFKLMIRQPDFVKLDFFDTIRKMTMAKKPHKLLQEVSFEGIEEGKCIQMLHIGSYDSEPESFQIMEDFAAANGLKRLSKTHREVYLSDPRKVAPEKLKTLLRFQLDK